MPNDNQVGVDMASDEANDYAFLMESSSIEYVIERNCDVTQIGGLLDDKGYGIAMKKGKICQFKLMHDDRMTLNFVQYFPESEYRNALSEGVLRLQESGKLAALKIKWWKEKKVNT